MVFLFKYKTYTFEKVSWPKSVQYGKQIGRIKCIVFMSDCQKHILRIKIVDVEHCKTKQIVNLAKLKLLMSDTISTLGCRRWCI